MKAFLLAAGLGTRLRPLTDTMPKCMVPIDGRPLLDIWLESLAEAGISQVLINLHHLPHVITRHLASHPLPLHVRTVFERKLLGSAGTLVANRFWIKQEKFFLVCNADGLTDFRLEDLIIAHRAHQLSATLAVCHSPNPSACGILQTDSIGVMTSFTEKPESPVSNLANAGIYAFAPSVLNEISPGFPQDIGHGLLPRLIRRAHTVQIPGFYRDIGTPEDYQHAREDWAAR